MFLVIRSLPAGPLDRPVLIHGENGVGKGKAAELIHGLTVGENAPFITINASAMSDVLMESELFGHCKGAFCGAEHDKTGKIAMADGGSLFLKEIGYLSLSMQERLLRFLEEKTYSPVGGNQKNHSNFQLISSTSSNLPDNVEKKRFKVELFDRIRRNTRSIPPLRKRTRNIHMLIRFFLSQPSRRVYPETFPVTSEIMSTDFHGT